MGSIFHYPGGNVKLIKLIKWLLCGVNFDDSMGMIKKKKLKKAAK
jgi:hypothetical protein